MASALKLKIGIFGRRNVGKSSILNMLTTQDVSIVSDRAGTTTDPVEKPMEILPIGQVIFIDTAGIDDVGSLGELRIAKTNKVFERADVALLVSESGMWGSYEEEIILTCEKHKTPCIVIFNKSDIYSPNEKLLKKLSSNGKQTVVTSCLNNKGTEEVRSALINSVPDEFLVRNTIVGDLVRPGSLIVLVVPIDMEAPKGRLILPQVQTIRDILDNDSYCLVVKEHELRDALSKIKGDPDLVVTDSQSFLKVAGDTPEHVSLTSFSILFARLKGDLELLAMGAKAIDNLKDGSKILIAESCSHHAIADDIGRTKIPRWLRRYSGCDLDFTFSRGHDFKDKIELYDLVIHCGGCMFNKKEILYRINYCKEHNVPVTNYGMTIAFTLGIFERALKPFGLDL